MFFVFFPVFLEFVVDACGFFSGVGDSAGVSDSDDCYFSVVFCCDLFDFVYCFLPGVIG